MPKKSMLTNANVKKEIDGLLDAFKEPDSLELIAKSMFNRGREIPSDNWSVLNKLIMLCHGTLDARGSKAWWKIGRKVRKAGHFCIIAPKMITIKKDEKDKNGDYKKFQKLIGFYPIAVWPVENTDGKDVDYKTDKEMPEFLCEKVAKKWGIKITQGFKNPAFNAAFNPSKSEIQMATDSQQTFFHELAHAAEKELNGSIKTGQEATQEIVAEFSASVLMRMFGLKAGTKNSYDYIKSYAYQKDGEVADSVVPLVSRISKVVNLILSENEKLSSKRKYKKAA